MQNLVGKFGQQLESKFGKQLESFKTTRKLLRVTSGVQQEQRRDDLTEAEVALRKDFAWQRRVTDATLVYSQAVVGALHTIGCASEDFLSSGVIDAGLEAPILEALLFGVAEAHRCCAEAATRVQRPLEVHRAALAACAEHLQKADLTALELKHYDEKLEQLEEEMRVAAQKVYDRQEKFAAWREHDAVSRNKVKHKQAQDEAAAAHAAAQRALDEAASQREGLCRMARDLVGSIAEALQHLAGPAAAGAPAGEAEEPEAAAGGASASGARAAASQPALARSITPGYAAALLGSEDLLHSLCRQYLRRYDTDGNSKLDHGEAMQLLRDLQLSLGVPAADWPSEEELRDSLRRYGGADAGDSSPSAAVGAERFPAWFAAELREALAKSRRGSGNASSATPDGAAAAAGGAASGTRGAAGLPPRPP